MRHSIKIFLSASNLAALLTLPAWGQALVLNPSFDHNENEVEPNAAEW